MRQKKHLKKHSEFDQRSKLIILSKGKSTNKIAS